MERFSQTRNLSRLDRTIVGVCLVILSVASSLLFFDRFHMFTSRREKLRLQSLGTLITAESDVRRRLPTGVAWMSIQLNDTIFEGDAIYTGPQSTASILMKGGARIDVEADSMIVLKTLNKVPLLVIQSGSVTGALSQQQTVAVRTGGRTVSVQGENARIRLAHKKNQPSQLSVVEGLVRLKAADRPQDAEVQVMRNQSAMLNAENNSVTRMPASQSHSVHPIAVVTSSPIELLSPNDGKQFSVNPDSKIHLEWSAAELAEEYHIQISKTVDFETSVLDQTVKETKISLDGAGFSGVYYWRVAAVGKTQGRSLSRQFHVRSSTPPSLRSPVGGEKIFVQFPQGSPSAKDELPIPFRWEHSNLHDQVVVQFSRDVEFKKAEQNMTTTSSEVAISGLGAGVWYWRAGVRASADESQIAWSSTESFVLLRESPERNPASSPHEPVSVPPPTPLFDSNPPQGPVNLPAPELAPEIEFEVRLPTLESPPSNRSEPVSRQWGFGVGSQRIPIWLMGFAFVGTTQAEVSKKKEPTDPILKWPKVEGTNHYWLEISELETFESKLISTKVEGESFRWTGARVGQFFWRVASVDAQGRAGQFSAPSKLRVRMAKLYVPSIRKIKFEERGDSAPHSIQLEWRGSDLAKSYEIEVAETSEFTNSKKWTVAKTQSLFELGSSEIYYWRVRAQTSENTWGSYSEVGKIEVQRVTVLSKVASASPNNESFVFVLPQIPGFQFRWSQVVGADAYEVQISADKNYEQVHESSVVEGLEYQTKKEVPEGKVYWRIRARKNSSTSPWSEQKVYVVKKPELLPPPAELLPRPRRFLSGFGSAKLDLQWEAVSKAKAYVLEVAEDMEFKKNIHTSFTEVNRESVSLPPGKIYFWRVTPAEALPLDFADMGDGLLKSGKSNESGKIEVIKAESLSLGVAGGIQELTQTTDAGSGAYTSRGSHLQVIVDKWSEASSWGWKARLGLTSQSLSPDGGGGTTLTRNETSGEFSLLDRSPLTANWVVFYGIGALYSPTVSLQLLNSEWVPTELYSWQVAETLGAAIEPNFGEYLIRASLSLHQSLQVFSLGGTKVSLEGRKRWDQFWIGAETSYDRSRYQVSNRTSSTSQSTVATIQPSEIKFLLSVGYWY